MSRTESINFLLLERSMNMQARMMTIREYLRKNKVINELNKDRQIKRFNFDKWNEDMQKCFSKSLKRIISNKESEYSNNELKILNAKIENFYKCYQDQIKEIQEQELHYEKLNENLINLIFKLIDHYELNLREENSKIEKKSIERKTA